MQIGILGALEARFGDRSLTLGGTKQRAVLAMLLLAPTPGGLDRSAVRRPLGRAVPDSAIMSGNLHFQVRRILSADGRITVNSVGCAAVDPAICWNWTRNALTLPLERLTRDGAQHLPTAPRLPRPRCGPPWRSGGGTAQRLRRPPTGFQNSSKFCQADAVTLIPMPRNAAAQPVCRPDLEISAEHIRTSGFAMCVTRTPRKHTTKRDRNIMLLNKNRIIPTAVLIGACFAFTGAALAARRSAAGPVAVTCDGLAVTDSCRPRGLFIPATPMPTTSSSAPRPRLDQGLPR